jgi:hypothetical protein
MGVEPAVPVEGPLSRPLVVEAKQGIPVTAH